MFDKATVHVNDEKRLEGQKETTLRLYSVAVLCVGDLPVGKAGGAHAPHAVAAPVARVELGRLSGGDNLLNILSLVKLAFHCNLFWRRKQTFKNHNADLISTLIFVVAGFTYNSTLAPGDALPCKFLTSERHH